MKARLENPELAKEEKKTKVPEKGEKRNAWIVEMRAERESILEKRKARKLRKEKMSKRGTVEAQNRMRAITQLATNKKVKRDQFGKNDEDWQVYLDINLTLGDSDSEGERDSLTKIEENLLKYDDKFKEESASRGEFDPNSEEFYQLHCGTEKFRCVEALFKPKLVGIDQRGIAATAAMVLSSYGEAEMEKMAGNLLLSGSGCGIPGLRDRFLSELRSWMPCGMELNLKTADGEASWRGAAKWARSAGFTTMEREEAERERGFLKEHAFSNKFIPPRSEEEIAAENDAGRSKSRVGKSASKADLGTEEKKEKKKKRRR